MKGKRRSTFGKHRVSLADRFWSKVRKAGDDECWIWIGAKTHGYGYLGGRKQCKAHRVSYELNVGTVPDGLCVCHRCDNPPCVNPKHLFLGTLADNNADRDAKGRGSKKDGELNPNVKLTVEDVYRVRRLLSEGVTQQAIADKFGVCQVTISGIHIGRLWKGV